MRLVRCRGGCRSGALPPRGNLSEPGMNPLDSRCPGGVEPQRDSHEIQAPARMDVAPLGLERLPGDFPPGDGIPPPWGLSDRMRACAEHGSARATHRPTGAFRSDTGGWAPRRVPPRDPRGKRRGLRSRQARRAGCPQKPSPAVTATRAKPWPLGPAWRREVTRSQSAFRCSKGGGKSSAVVVTPVPSQPDPGFSLNSAS